MKKGVTLLLCFLTAFALLAGCGPASTAAESPKESVSAEASTPAEATPEATATPVPSEAAVLEMGEPFTLEEGTLVITEVDGNPMFAPADMAETDHAIAVTAQMDPAVAGNKALIKSAALKGKDGTEYKLGPYMTKELDDKTQITFVFAIPKGLKVSDVTFWLNGEGRKLS